jgi:glycerol-3-phosphate dehydrogenase
MALDLAKASAERGAVVLNYFKVTGILKDNEGKISGVMATDLTKGKVYNISSRVVINATGVYADEILKLDNPAAHNIIKPSQGIHLVVDTSFLGGNSAIMIPKTDDGRVLFAIPWYGKVVLGTTDTPVEKVDQEPVALKQEVDFILQTAARYLVKPPSEKDILSVFAGLRPLAADPENPHSTKEISRRHKIIVSRSNLISITGGKWTTYRRMATETIDKAIRSGLLEKRKCRTELLQLGTITGSESDDRMRIYEKGSEEIKQMIRNSPELGARIGDDLPYTKAEIIWICRNEMPVMLEDVLARRTRALILNAGESYKVSEKAANIMAKESGYDDDWVKDQVFKFSILVKKYSIQSF